MSKLLKNLILIVCIAVVLTISYMFMTGGVDDLTGESALDLDPMVEITLRTEKILADTQEISRYTLDVSLFTDSRFKSLKDFGVEINDVDTGRDNPFLPVR